MSQPRPGLMDAARTMLSHALGVYQDVPRATGWLSQQLRRFEEPLRVAVTGRAGAGKTTLVSALGGRHPPRSLRDITLIDTTLMDTATDPARISADADAVLFLIRNRHGADVQLLRTVAEQPPGGPAPVPTIAVLARADELGGGRIDALSSAKQIARRYRRDVELQALCLTVIAVAGLIAQSGGTLATTEFAALSALAAMPRAQLDEFLLSADRFLAGGLPIALELDLRQSLLARFGIFGLRLTTTLIRNGVDSQTALAAELVQRSGLPELRESIRQYVIDRRNVLKARSALHALASVLRFEPRPGARQLLDDMERVLASAHELRELRLLAALRTGRTKLPAELAEQAERIVGGHGTGVLDRLGCDYEPSEGELRRGILDALDRWQEQVENPLLSAEQRRAARIVLRSCEAMLAELHAEAG